MNESLKEQYIDSAKQKTDKQDDQTPIQSNYRKERRSQLGKRGTTTCKIKADTVNVYL